MAPIRLAAGAINRAVYAALAAARRDVATDVMAGVTVEMLLAHPGLSGQAIRDAVAELDDAVTAVRSDVAVETAPNDAVRMTRILVRVTPALVTAELRDGARRYARAFIRNCRRGTGQLRQVAPLELQFDRSGAVDRFRRESWERLHEAATARQAVGRAIDQGPIGATLGFGTGQNAATLLDLVPIQPLRDFVLGHLRPDGALTVETAELDPALAAASAPATELRDAYAANLIAINRAEQRARDAARAFPGLAAADARAAAESDLVKAIEAAEKKQQELDRLLKDVSGGVDGALGVMAFLAREFDEEFAADIGEFSTISLTMLGGMRKFAGGAIATAKVVANLLAASSSQLLLGGGIGFSFVMVALMIQVTGLLGGRAKPINQIILEELRKVSKQITEMRDEMRVRFDRIETKLDRIYQGLLDRLAEIDFTLGEVRGDVGEMQLSLYNLHGQLQRLNRDVHAFLAAGHRRELVETINGSLNFAELTGRPLEFDGFRTAENLFFSWGRDHAKDALQAGPEQREFTDDSLLAELTALPLATNVNYLREVPAAMFDLAPLAADRLANPFDWIVAGESYAQLSEESPDHAAQISPNRVRDLIDVGEILGESLSKIADVSLACQLLGHYQRITTRLKATIDLAERDYRRDPGNRLFDIDLWGGPGQIPARHFFQEDFAELPRCGGGRFDDAHVTVPSNVFPFDHDRLRPYMIASNLSTSRIPGVAAGLARLSACVQAIWRTIKVEDLGLGNMVRITYRLSILVNIRYGDTAVFTHRFDTAEQFAPAIPKQDLGTFDPVTDRRGKNPYPLLVGQGKNLWSKLDTFPDSHSLVNPELLTATTDLVTRKLKLVQRHFYGEIARRFAASGDQIQIIGRRLDGSKLLWQSLLTTGLPLSVEANEILHGLLFGNEAILGGVGSTETTLDNVRNLYAFFSRRSEDPPPTNILGDIQTLATTRMNQLSTLTFDLVQAIQDGGRPEPPDLFAPTLLRLTLLRP